MNGQGVCFPAGLRVGGAWRARHGGGAMVVRGEFGAGMVLGPRFGAAVVARGGLGGLGG